MLQGQMKVLNNRAKFVVFSCLDKAEQRDMRTTVTVGPCVPIPLCTHVDYTDLEAELKWHGLQVAGEH